MITHNPQSTPPTAAPAATVTATPAITASAVPSGKPHRVIKLGVDVHWREHVVVRQIDGTSPQPAQRFAPEAFVAWTSRTGSDQPNGVWLWGLGSMGRMANGVTY